PRPRGDPACGVTGPAWSAPKTRRPRPAAGPCLRGLEREQQRHPRPVARRRVDLDATAVRGDDTLGNREAEPAAVRLARVERLEHAGEILRRDAGPGIADGESDIAVLPGNLEGQAPTPVHRLHAVEGDIPEDLDDLVAVEGEARHGRIDRDAHVDAGCAGAV